LQGLEQPDRRSKVGRREIANLEIHAGMLAQRRGAVADPDASGDYQQQEQSQPGRRRRSSAASPT
jgi:hypothetical protein